MSATPSHTLQLTPSAEEEADAAAPVSRSKRNVGDREKYWPHGKTLKIAMYDADNSFIEAVKSAASKWLPHINIKFDFVSGEEGDIRIAENFISNQGSSMIGTDALKVPQGLPTMMLPYDHLSPRFAYVVMHEFGHLLGALHAHQHPDTEIPWNRSKAYELYKAQAGQTKSNVDEQVLPLPRSNTRHYEPYDRHSIMHYDISEHTTLGHWKQAENPQISAGDIALMRKAYPKTADTPQQVTSPAPSSPRSYRVPPTLPEEYRRLWRDVG
ncbi:M12 family metallopeptidase [Pseudomonas spelaei]|nr:M12 family metallopeptidase [Pseudomonas spelaei]